MREILFLAASLAGGALFTALAIIIKPESIFWYYLLWGSAGILFLVVFVLTGDLLLRRSVKVPQQNVPKRLKAIFRMDDEKCVHCTKLSILQNAFGETVTTSTVPYPPYVTIPTILSPKFYSDITTLVPSSGGTPLIPDKDIRLFRVRVNSVSGTTHECRGTIFQIERHNYKSSIPIDLPFAMAEKYDEATNKTIHYKVPAYLDVLYITKDNKAFVKSHLNLPHAVDTDKLFAVGCRHAIFITIGAKDSEPETIKLAFDWTGDWKTAKMSQIIEPHS